MTISLETWHVISLILTLFGGAYTVGKVFFNRFESNLLKHLDKLEEKFSDHTEDMQLMTSRVTKLEEQVKNLPDQQLITEINGDMKQLRAEVTGLRDVIKPLTRSIERVNDYLLREKK